MTILYLVAAWVLGIFISSSSNQTAPVGWLVLAAVCVVAAYGSRNRRPWKLTFVCGLFFALGAARHAEAVRPLSASHVAHYADTGFVRLTGVITGEPDIRDNHVNLRVKAETLTQEQQQVAVSGLVLIQAPRYGDYHYGDRLAASGSLLTPPEFDDFSYRDYLARRGIYAMIPNAQVEPLAHDQGEIWYTTLYDLKERAYRTINRILPSPQAPLMSGILLGNESGISDNVREAFNRTGTSHVIAISGANLIVVIQVLLGLLKPPLGERRAGWATIAGVAAYTIFVGGDPAVVRAAIMGSLSLLAVQWGRRAYGLTSLAFSIWLMTLLNPLTLWDIGFQLSVAATAGLVLLSDDFVHILQRILQRGFAQATTRQITQWLSEPVAVSLAAQITTTPLILVYFGRLSIVSFLANLLIAPAQPYIMTTGWLATLAGLVWIPLGDLLAWITWLPLTYTLEIVRALGRLDWASTSYTPPTSYTWMFYSLLLAATLLRFQHRDDRAALLRALRQRITTYSLMVSGLILTGLVWYAALSQPDGKLHVWFLDVGHGTAVLIQTPEGAQFLVDGGPNPTQLRDAVGDSLPFWDRNLDVLIVTQPKTASINALPALLDRYDIKLALTNGQSTDEDTSQALAAALEKKKITTIPVQAGYQLTTSDGVTLSILHPQNSPDEATEKDTASLVLRVSYGDASFLLMPDISPEAEQDMIDAGWYLGSTVLQLASHGSSKSNPPALLQLVEPQVAVVTVGAGNRSGLPAPEVLEGLSGIGTETIYRTDDHGTIELVTDGHTLQIFAEN